MTVSAQVNRRAFLASTAGAAAACANPNPRPNLVLIFADDLGYGDVGAFGAQDIRTPSLDRMADEGVRLTNHLVAAPVCSPSRAGLMTGRYPARVGIEGVLRDHHDEMGLGASEQTLAERLSQAGYETALIGKWHLGMTPETHPNRRGFDYFWGFLNGTIDYYTHLSRGGGWSRRPVTFRNNEPLDVEGYFPERLYDEAVRWIGQPHDRPFLLYLPLALPHAPPQAPERWKAEYSHIDNENRATYAAMVSCMDDGIGRILDALDRQSDNTLVVFLSDHGWAWLGGERRDSDAGDNGPFSGGKYELGDGGLRTPAIARWKGRIPEGSVSDALTWALDWFPTFESLAAPPHTSQNPLDGLDIGEVLWGSASAPERTLFWRFQDDVVGIPFSLAARQGRWKYLRVGETEALYDVDSDPAESVDRSADEPTVFAALQTSARRWNTEMGRWAWQSKG